jgi:type II secretory pathway component PulK
MTISSEGTTVDFERGQALITLLFFMIIAIIITSAAVIIIILNSLSGTKFQEGTLAYQVAESGADNAILRLLRDPNYTGEVLTIGNGTATISVSASLNTYVATSSGQVGNFVRKVEVTATYVNNLLTVTSEKEVF